MSATTRTHRVRRGAGVLAGLTLIAALGDAAATCWFVLNPVMPRQAAVSIDRVRGAQTQLASAQQQARKQAEALATLVAAQADTLRRLDRDQGASRTRLADMDQRLQDVQAHGQVGGVPASVGQAAAPEAAAPPDDVAGEHALRLARVSAARDLLRRGRPLGPIPGAPPALARFATSAPPAGSSLILSFDTAAYSALSSSARSTAAPAGGSRMRRWLAQLVTLRHGDRVLLGDPAQAVLEDARRHLRAGDVAGAVGTLRALPPQAGEAMSAWRERAQAVVDAEAALDALQEAG